MKQLATVLFLFAITAMAFAAEAEKEITALLTAVENQKGLVFIRNGSEYSASQAADHLRVKRKAAGDRIQTAEQFITYCGTKSSVSGQRYKVRTGEGKEEDASEFLTGLLQHLRHP